MDAAVTGTGEAPPEIDCVMAKISRFLSIVLDKLHSDVG